jgi:glycosyltransferase involved in cell wall biosynthesis
MRVLFVSPYLPHRAVGHGGGAAIFDLIREMASLHEVRLLCFRRHGELGLEKELEDAGVAVDVVPYLSGRDRGLRRALTIVDRIPRLLFAALSGRPYRSMRYSHAGMFRRLRRVVEEWRPDVVQVEFFAMAPYARQLVRLRQKSGAKTPLVVLSTLEVETLVRLRRLLAAPRGLARVWASLRLRRIRRFEASAATWADRVLCVSEQDRQMLQALCGVPGLRTLPLGVPLAELPDARPNFTPPRRLLFVGSFEHPPNRAAVEFLVHELLPALRSHYPDLVCEIAGRNPPLEVLAAASASGGSLVVHGFVGDLAALFARSWLFVAPLFAGGGIKTKILEAMGRGAPVLTTPIGLDGIDAPPGQAVGCAEDPATYIRESLRLLEEPELLARFSREGRAYIAQHHDWPGLARKLSGIYDGD